MSNNQFKHLLAFDLASYGAGMSIINQYVDDNSVKVFEISPSGSSAILILLSSDFVSLQIVKSQTESVFKSQILASSLLQDIHSDLLPAYLSQNKAEIKNNLVIFEGNHVSLGLLEANSVLCKGGFLVDFRVIRTFPKNVIITFTGEAAQSFHSLDFKKTIITDIQPVLKNYYEIN